MKANLGSLTEPGAAQNNVSVIDTANNTVIAKVQAGVGPFSIAVTPDGKRVWVSNQGPLSGGPQSTISVIDTATDKVVATFPVDFQPDRVFFTPDGKFAWVTFSPGNFISVIASADVRKPEDIEPAFKKFEAEHVEVVGAIRRATISAALERLMIEKEDLHRCGLFDLIVGAYDDYGTYRCCWQSSPAGRVTQSAGRLDGGAS
jgi:YVTN family beta-propeller protein